MFTGIIEECGKVLNILPNKDFGKIKIQAKTVLENTKLGDSIAVNGVCLTVTNLDKNSFTADIMNETFERSNLGKLQNGSFVNLERAMPANARFGGHFVSGHIDGTGTITKIEKQGISTWIYISTNSQILDLIVQKGSIAIDGISLTVAKITTQDFAVSIIPHTASQTTLLQKKVGQIVNLENDLIGKYVQKLMFQNQNSLQNDLQNNFNQSEKDKKIIDWLNT